MLVSEDYVCKVTDFGLAVARGNYGYAWARKVIGTRNSCLVCVKSSQANEEMSI